MSYKKRVLTKTILRAVKTFPAIVLTGPRQAGKTTLLKELFKKTHKFVSLENFDIRILALEDPVGFLERYPAPIVIDEVQYAPELLSYIKTKIDENRKPGQWLLTGSQNFVLMNKVTQSLAGRAAVLTLLPLSYAEIVGTVDTTLETNGWLERFNKDIKAKNMSLAHWILRGSYPELVVNRKVDRELWCGSYITTYMERDIRNLSAIGDLNQFERFIKLCATRTGQILNLTDMARDIGISLSTAKRWLSILEAGYQVYLLYPYYKNIGKRLIKSPKLYFTDTALASYLLGIHNNETLLKSPSFGPLFETAVIVDVLKRFYNFGQLPSLYYLRTRDGLEADLVIETGKGLYLFEIKTSMTITPKHASSLKTLMLEIKNGVRGATVLSPATWNGYLAIGINHYEYGVRLL